MNINPKFNYWVFLIFIFFYTRIFSQVSYQEAFPNLDFNFPVEIQSSNDGSNRLFVVEQPGRIKVFPNKSDVTLGELTTFLDISSIVSYSSGQEIGLLGLAFHPNYSVNGHVYVYYIDQPNNYRINIARYQVNSNNSNLLNPSSGVIIAQFIKNQSDSNHNGGKIEFGPDGYLYISVGDGGGGGDPQGNGQNLNTVFGSLLRIDVDIDGSNPIETNPDLPNGNYEIPSNNPRVGQSGLDELYAWGIRNTWKFSFDASGNLWGADVGQNIYEEINLITRGGNYGWNKFEANSEPSYGSGTTLMSTPDIKPIFFNDHSNGDNSITGGYVYHGSLSSSLLQNKYIYGDYVSGRVWALSYNPANSSTTNELLFKTNGEFISSFGEDEAGELYFSDYGSNVKLYKLTETIIEPVTTAVNGIGEWKPISTGTNGNVETIANSSNGITYVGGTFSTAGNLNVNNLASISTVNEWEVFSNGSNGSIYSIDIAPDGTIYASGEFTTIGGVSANNIAKWNGSSWSSLGVGTNGPVLKIKFSETGALFVGGVFSKAGGITVNNITKWENNTWSALVDNTTNISGTNNEIRSIGFDEDNNLYIGGNFDTAGGVSANRIARWNGANWSALGTGTSGFVQAIASIGDYLYMGGNFAIAGNKTVNRIARFNKNNESWESLGNGLSGNVNTITSNGTYIYVGGSFSTASDDGNVDKIVNNIARWSADNGWEALGTNTNVGVNIRVNSLTFTNNNTELLVGGNFSIAGNINANNVAIWSENFCEEDSIIPEYQINGVFESGNNTLTVNEGDELVISMLPNNVSFTLTLPNGSNVNGDYSFGSITAEQSGTYTIETNQGCIENLEISVQPSEGADQDNDGVFDENDNCANTLSGESVDSNGCTISQLDSDNDGVNDSLDDCPNTTNGTLVDLTGCPVQEIDSDEDGVNDTIDLCPNTLKGITVDENGCAVRIYPNNQFKITSVGTSCIGSNNGSIFIESITNENFLASITGATKNITLPFTDILTIKDLNIGDYDLCISSIDSPNYQTCSKIIITEPLPLSVQLDFNSLTNSITLKMNGAKEYTIEINGKSMQTENQLISLPLYDEVNNVRVSTSQSCQGEFEDTVILENSFLIYPNPVSESLSLDVKSLTSDTVEIAIFTEAGLLIHSETYLVKQSKIELNTSAFSSGIYFLRVKNDKVNKSFKLIKQ
ncbi:PQQ-dependent sugar dehydrogenase [uncultured Maribacter sp.]|uniref:PQQ-dependent sugar dehydrogenase n=1 Tax=uncultured Maribacter sp. TaxID=431308 RepID=UPI0030D9E1FC|tara:strand:- start:3462 stop:7034 length:3573 start_codon:yes stop_codon:yes gene_type:complete